MNERETRKWTESQRYYFNGGNRDKFSAMKVSRQCPLVLLVKID
jgi:hypothetical protein